MQFSASDPTKLGDGVQWIRNQAGTSPELETHVAGPAGLYADFGNSFKGIDGRLLLVSGLIVLVILILVYRSPILPFVVLAVAGTALGMANGTAYLLAKAGLLTISGDAQGILDVLVLGAATDYALLLTARYREELRRHEDRHAAMAAALFGHRGHAAVALEITRPRQPVALRAQRGHSSSSDPRSTMPSRTSRTSYTCRCSRGTTAPGSSRAGGMALTRRINGGEPRPKLRRH